MIIRADCTLKQGQKELIRTYCRDAKRRPGWVVLAGESSYIYPRASKPERRDTKWITLDRYRFESYWLSEDMLALITLYPDDMIKRCLAATWSEGEWHVEGALRPKPQKRIKQIQALHDLCSG